MNIAAETRIQNIGSASARGQERVSRILDAATDLFLRDGFRDTAVDAIVEKSGGSKATLYSYFPTKEDLFRAVVDNIVVTAIPPMKIDTCENIRAGLQAFGEARLKIVFSRRHQALLRLVIGERERFPDLARMYYERGPRVGRESLNTYLDELRDNKKLEIDNVSEAVEFFVGMLTHEWYVEYLLYRTKAPTRQQIAARVEHVVNNFLAIYHRD